MRIGVIGCGSMGKMLLEQFSVQIPPAELLVSNRSAEKLRAVSGIASVCPDNRALAEQADIIFLCVRPADMPAVLAEIRDAVSPEALLVSLNGSISFEALGRMLPHRTAKVIPSVTAEIGRSQTLVCYNETTPEPDRQRLETLLRCMGDVIVLPEQELGMGAELVSCMPGFLAAIFDVICRSAKRHTAIPPEQIADMVLRTAAATAALMTETGAGFQDIVSRVATKGGITEAGTAVINERFPEIAAELFARTLEKRAQTACAAAEALRAAAKNTDRQEALP